MLFWQVLGVFATLSLLAVGGINALVPEMHRQVVELNGWLDDATFVQSIALSQAAPGPNILGASLVGWRIAGGPGLLAATLGIVLPSALLAWTVGGALIRRGDAPWLRALRGGLVPVAVGLIFASGVVLAGATGGNWTTPPIVLAAAAIAWRTALSPLWLLAGGAVLGGLLG